MVGIAPLFAVCIMKRDTVKGLKGFRKAHEMVFAK